MAIALEKQFELLLHDVRTLQKQLVRSKRQHAKTGQITVDRWNLLSRKVSLSWDTVTAVDEIAAQREKQW